MSGCSSRSTQSMSDGPLSVADLTSSWTRQTAANWFWLDASRMHSVWSCFSTPPMKRWTHGRTSTSTSMSTIFPMGTVGKKYFIRNSTTSSRCSIPIVSNTRLSLTCDVGDVTFGNWYTILRERERGLIVTENRALLAGSVQFALILKRTVPLLTRLLARSIFIGSDQFARPLLDGGTRRAAVHSTFFDTPNNGTYFSCTKTSTLHCQYLESCYTYKKKKERSTKPKSFSPHPPIHCEFLS